MANSDASSSTTCTVRVLVSFYLAAPDDSSSARTSPIHKEKFNVPLSSDEHKDLFNFVRHLKTFTGLAAWTWRRQCNPPGRRGWGCSCILPFKDSAYAYRTTNHAFLSCSFFILRYKKLFLFAEALKTRVNSKYQSKGSTHILHLLAFVEIRLINVFLWERKAGFGKLMKNVWDAGF